MNHNNIAIDLNDSFDESMSEDVCIDIDKSVIDVDEFNSGFNVNIDVDDYTSTDTHSSNHSSGHSNINEHPNARPTTHFGMYLNAISTANGNVDADDTSMYNSVINVDDFDITKQPSQNGIDINSDCDNCDNNGDKNYDNNGDDWENSDDTVIVDDYPVVFVDNIIVSYMQDIIAELNNIPEDPIYNMVITGINSEYNNVQFEIQQYVDKNFKEMARKLSDLKQDITRDYYATKEFTSPLTLKFIKGQVNRRYKDFSDWISTDIYNIHVYNEMIDKLTFLNLEKFDDYIKRYHVQIQFRTNIRGTFKIRNIIGKMNRVLKIVLQSDGKDFDSMYK